MPVLNWKSQCYKEEQNNKHLRGLPCTHLPHSIQAVCPVMPFLIPKPQGIKYPSREVTFACHLNSYLDLWLSTSVSDKRGRDKIGFSFIYSTK